MKMKHAGKYRSDAFAVIHEAAEALHHVGAINKVTMREFDETCHKVVEEIKPSQIRALREREHVSQPIFARYLNVSTNLVSDWEHGKRKPGGSALRLLRIIQKHGIETIT